MILREIKCKSLLNPSQLADYCINPYVGCEHGCKYCYAEPITRRFSFHKEHWGEFVDVKVNALEILKNELQKRSRGKVFISSLTDAYQPIEKKYELTRKILEMLLKFQFPICIQTKSSLVARDIDLIKKFDDREVGFTITTLDDSVRKNFELNSSSIKEKLDVIKQLKDNGIKVYVFFGPMLPYLSDNNLDEFFQTMNELKVDEMIIDRLNLKAGVMTKLEKVLVEKYPELASRWKDALSNKTYYENLKKEIEGLCKKNNLDYNFCY